MPDPRALLLALLLPACELAHAGKIDLDAPMDTGAASPTTTTLAGPATATLDTDALQLTMTWPDGHNEEIPFDDIIRVERARPYEGFPDELFVRVADGRRILLARGNAVATHATLIPVLSKLPYSELAPGKGHLAPEEVPAHTPQLVIGQAGSGFALQALGTGGGAIQAPTLSEKPLHPAKEPGAPDAAFEGAGGGDLANSFIDAVMKKAAGPVRDCYERELRKDPSLRGKVVGRFVIETDGTVQTAQISGTSLDRPTTEACIRELLLGLHFPVPRGGTVVVSYPFLFAPR